MALSKRLKFEVMNRDGFTCQYCGAKSPDVQLTVDHVVPQALGGSDDPSNLTTACRPCNEGKASSHPSAPTVAAVKERAAGYADAVSAAFAERESAMLETKAIVGRLSEQWDEYGDARRPADWGNGLEYFLRAGLSESFILEAMAIAMTADHIPWRNKWRYMCGVCHKTIKQVHDGVAARSSISGEEASSAAAEAPIDPAVLDEDDEDEDEDDEGEEVSQGEQTAWSWQCIQEMEPWSRMRWTAAPSDEEMRRYGVRMARLYSRDAFYWVHAGAAHPLIHAARNCETRPDDFQLFSYEAWRMRLTPFPKTFNDLWSVADELVVGAFCMDCCLEEVVQLWPRNFDGQLYSQYLRDGGDYMPPLCNPKRHLEMVDTLEEVAGVSA